MHLHVNPHGRTPVYRQIQHQIARAIADRQLHPGELLQPQQELASQLAVSPAAVRKAYRELESEGLCQRQPRDRFRVSHPDLAARPDGGTDLALALLRRELLTEELQSAREVQHRLLPPAELSGSGWAVSSRSYSAGALAGDLHDVIRRPDGALDLVIGDVAGKGLAASLLMAVTQSLIAVAAAEETPGAALESLNARLTPLLGNRDFVALAWARFDQISARVQLANAGLPDPYLLPSSGATKPLAVSGERLPLGIRRSLSYSTKTLSMTPGDRLLLLTDGIPEATDAGDEPLGYDGLARLLDHPEEPRFAGQPGDWLDRLLDRVRRRTGSLMIDDWTAMLLESPSLEDDPCRS